MFYLCRLICYNSKLLGDMIILKKITTPDAIMLELTEDGFLRREVAQRWEEFVAYATKLGLDRDHVFEHAVVHDLLKGNRSAAIRLYETEEDSGREVIVEIQVSSGNTSMKYVDEMQKDA